MNKKSKPQQVNARLNWKDLYQAQLKKITQRITQLRKVIRKWDETHQSDQNIPRTDLQTITAYLDKISVYTSKTRFFQFKQHRNIHDQMIQNLQNLDDAYTNFKMFGQSKWTLLITPEIVQQIQTCIVQEQKLKQFLTRISLYLQGYIPINNSFKQCENNLNQIGSSESSSCKYYIESHEQLPLMISIGIQKIPKLQFNKQNVSNMVFTPFIQILKICTEELTPKIIKQSIERFELHYKWDPTKNLSQQKLLNDNEAMEKLGKKVTFFKYQKLNQQFINSVIQTHPIIFKQKICQQDQYKQFLFYLKTYEENKLNFQKKCSILKQKNDQKERQKIAEKQRLKQFFSFSSSKSLINIYNKIPNTLYKLTNDQKSIVTYDDNLIVIGRSGTGKTLCALLRLFVIQFFFKFRQFKKLGDQNRSFQPQDLAKIIGLKNIFLTASPYLIKQIKKQYDQIVQHMQVLLMQHKEKKNQKDQNSQSQISCEKEVFYDELEDADLDQLMEMYEQKIQRMKSLNELNQMDFPGFFSIKNFITMMDGTLKYPMLYRNKNIQKKQIQQQEVIDKPKQEGKKKNRMTEGEEENEQNYFNHEINNDQQNLGWIQQQKLDNKQIEQNKKEEQKQQIKLIEVDYEVFSKQFWPQVPKQYFNLQKQLAPANIWAEIYSIIKGSYISHKSHTKYLSKTQYLKTSRKQYDEELNYKKVVYQVFQYYQSWKQRTHHYDFLDLVNHILSDIDIYGYQGPMINYLFIDEVQDLPPATMYLVSKIVTNGLFYCGDSAQTIAKGVNFKFRDIPKMFHQKFSLQPLSLQSPKDSQLTFNFRSHNEILKLGHSIITMIQMLFKGSIDKLKSQSSSFRGPVPLIVDGCNEVQLLNILTQQLTCTKNIDPDFVMEYQKHSPDGKIYRLSPQQIVLVRNQEEKSNLPYRLRQGVVLTFQEVKGLQYDDVVLVNFFSSSKFKDKWRLLSYLKVQFELVQKNKYQQSLKSKQDTSGHHLQGDKNYPKRHDWNVMPNLIQKNNKSYYQVPIITYNKDIQGQNLNNYYELLTELKILYTAITRARKTFIISQKSLPKHLQWLWTKMKAVRYVNKQNYQQIRQEIHQYRAIHKNKNIHNQEKAWKKQGFKWFLRKNYQQAIRCFRNINDMVTVKRIQAQMKANQAGVQMRRIRNQLQNPQNLSKQEFKIKKRILEAKKKPVTLVFNQAAKMFEDINRMDKAGKCYFSGQNYKKAFQCFKKINYIRGCAQCCQNLQLFQEAGQYYQKLKSYEKMLQCYQKSGNMKIVFQKLLNNIQKFTQSQQTCLKYGRVLLNYYTNDFLVKNQQFINGKQHKLCYSSLSPQFINKNISRYHLFECLQNLQKLLAAKVKLQKLRQKISPLKEQQKNLIQQRKEIQYEFQCQKPYLSFKQAQKIYLLKRQMESTGLDRLFQEQCRHHKLQERDLFQLMTNFQKVRPIINDIKNEQKQLSSRMQGYLKEHDSLLATHGDLKDIEFNISLLKKIYDKHLYQGYKKQQLIKVKKINTKQIFQIQNNGYKYEMENDFKNLSQNKGIKEEQFQIQSFLDQSFDSQLSLSNYSMSQMSYLQPNNQLFMFQFYCDKIQLGELISSTKDILIKMKNNIDNPLKPPFPQQHHLSIDSKIQSAICKINPSLQTIMTFLKKFQRLGQNYLASLTCQFYELYDIGKKYIISTIINFNKIYSKSKKVSQIGYQNSQKQIQQNSQVASLLKWLNQKYLTTQCFRTHSIKQRVIDSIVQSLLIQGSYRNIIKYMSQNKQYQTKIAYNFMNYTLLYESIIGKLTKSNATYKGKYYFLSEFKYKQDAKMLNSYSIQQIFYLYDSIQQNPFFNKINWKDSIKISNQKADQISVQVQRIMKNQQMQIQNMRKLIKEKKTYISQNLNEKHAQQKRHRKQNHQKALRQLENTIEQINAISKIIYEIMQEQKDIEKIIQNKKKQIKKLQTGLQAFNHKIRVYKGVNNILKQQQTKLRLTYQFYMYEINLYPFHQKNTQKHNYIPLIKIEYNLKSQIQQNQIQAFKLQQQKKRLQNQINLHLKDIKQKKQDQFNYQYQHSNLLLDKKPKNQQNVFKSDNLQTIQRQQFERQNDILEEMKEKLKKQQKKLQSLEREQRKKFLAQQQQKIILKNKQKHFKFVKKKLDNCSELPQEYRNGYFSLFMKMRQTKLQQSNTWDFKKQLKYVIQNCDRDFKKLDIFNQCEIIVLYLSVILYPQKNKIFDYLKNQSQQQVQYQREQIRKQIRRCDWKIKQIQQRVKKYQSGYITSQQQLQIQYITNQRIKLVKKFNSVGTSPNSTTQSKLKNMINKIYIYTNVVQNQSDLQFIELMLGFFQCKVIKNCQPLWFLDKQYAIVKSNSVLIKQSILWAQRNKQRYNKQDLFFYYFDQNKQYIIMKFSQAYLIMKSVLQHKHRKFLQIMKFRNQLDVTYKQKKFFAKDLIGPGKDKLDQNGFKLQKNCDYNSKKQIQSNYQIFRFNKILPQISEHKQKILRYYFQNGFKTPETFHFIHYQLKVLDQTKRILQKTETFSNLMIKDLKKRVQALKLRFDEWKNYIQVNKLKTNKSCQEEDDEAQNN